MRERAVVPAWALEEIGNVPYELKKLPFPPRASARELLEMNPLGTFTAFTDDALVMTESAAIRQYLAARSRDIWD